MKTFVSHSPDIEAGKYITNLLAAHKTQPTLLLVSGGSSMSVLAHIDPNTFGECMLIGTTDERYTKNEGNNFLTLQHSQFYAEATKRHARFIDSVPHQNETRESLRQRMHEQLNTFFQAHPQWYAVGIFGVGDDGHTASIFPEPEPVFNERYEDAELFALSEAPQIHYPERITVTPNIINEMLSDVVLYAIGEQKCNTVLSQIHTNDTLADHQLPARIPARHPQSVLFTDCENLI